ncbi:MAG TPA: hypothetical protein VK508_04755 [Cyclobacteriaceae bacterium]|nr:hypothetical protein [Cyclobacteriaceae bacterium]
MIGGAAKFVQVQNGEPKEFPLKGSIAYVDKYTAPQFFKVMSKITFDDGNYLPELYSLNPANARKLWVQSSNVAVPVMIQYLCEFFASDITLETGNIKCPVLIIRARFKEEMLSQKENAATNYIKPQFVDAWDRVANSNPLIKIHDVESSGVFTWKDQKLLTGKAIKDFMTSLTR